MSSLRRQGCLLALRFQSRSVRLGRSEALDRPGSRRPGRGDGALPGAWQRLRSAALLQYGEHRWFSGASVSPSPAGAPAGVQWAAQPCPFRLVPLLAGPQFSFPRLQEPTSKKPLAARAPQRGRRWQRLGVTLRVPLPPQPLRRPFELVTRAGRDGAQTEATALAAASSGRS